MLKALSESLGDTMHQTMISAKENQKITVEDTLTQEEKAMLYLYRSGKLHTMKPKKKKRKKK